MQGQESQVKGQWSMVEPYSGAPVHPKHVVRGGIG
jgi:hypothetical protein